MKIGFYGGMANNMYVFARAMADEGLDVCFIRDRGDRYPMSQPVWEDVPFTLPYDEMPRASYWHWSKWTQIENELNWEAPKWLCDPMSEPERDVDLARASCTRFIDWLFLRRYAGSSYRASVVRKMQSCDALVVCGIEGSVLANASGTPFVIVPHGGDLMVAAGLLEPKAYHVRSKIIHTFLRRQLVKAYSNAIQIGAHEPTGFSTDFFGAEEFFRKQKSCFLALPFSIRKREPPTERRQLLESVLSRLSLTVPESEFVGFVPSRVDFQWKGQDRLLWAMEKLSGEPHASRVHLIFSGWGANLEQARQFVAEQNLGARITFLNCALSKPFLYQFYKSADFVVDQFIIGTAGTSALEAMACGAPLVTWINDAIERPWGAPPVLQARTAEEILAVLQKIVSGGIDLEERGRSLQEWLDRIHNPATTMRDLISLCRSV